MAADKSLRRWSQLVTTPRSRYRRQYRILRVFHKNFNPLLTLGYVSRISDPDGLKLLFIAPPKKNLILYNLHRFFGSQFLVKNLITGLVNNMLKKDPAGIFARAFLLCWRKNNYFIFKDFNFDLFWLLRGGWKKHPTFFNCLPSYTVLLNTYYGGRKA